MLHRGRTSVIDRWRPLLIARLCARGAKRADAEDAVQEAVTRWLSSPTARQFSSPTARQFSSPTARQFSSPTALRPQEEEEIVAWLTRTAGNCLIDAHRHECSLAIFSLQDTDIEETASDDNFSDTIILRLLVEKAWEKLTEAERHLLILKVCGYSCHDIAVFSAVNEEAVKKRLQRAQVHFHELLHSSGLTELPSQNCRRQRNRSSLK